MLRLGLEKCFESPLVYSYKNHVLGSVWGFSSHFQVRNCQNKNFWHSFVSKLTFSGVSKVSKVLILTLSSLFLQHYLLREEWLCSKSVHPSSFWQVLSVNRRRTSSPIPVVSKKRLTSICPCPPWATSFPRWRTAKADTFLTAIPSSRASCRTRSAATRERSWYAMSARQTATTLNRCRFGCRKKFDNSINFLSHADETKFSIFSLKKIARVRQILSCNEPRHKTFTIASYHHKLPFVTLFLDHWFGGNLVLQLNIQNRKLGNKDMLIFRLVFVLQLEASASRKGMRGPVDKISTCMAFRPDLWCFGLRFDISAGALTFQLALRRFDLCFDVSACALTLLLMLWHCISRFDILAWA